MMTRGCKFDHIGMKMAGVYMKYTFRGKEYAIYTPAELTWACPYCHMVFLVNTKEIRKFFKSKKNRSEFIPAPPGTT